jgi:hypothetical protein
VDTCAGTTAIEAGPAIVAARNAVEAFRETVRNAVEAFRETVRNAVEAFRETGSRASVQPA